MKYNYFLISLLIIFLDLCPDILFAQCTINSTDVYRFDFDSKSYEIIKVKLNWANAASCAVTRGGYLVEINSLSEQNAIWAQVPMASITSSQTIVPESGSPGLWLGGNDILLEGTWVWNGNNDANSVAFYTGGSALLYTNFGCITSFPFTCEPDNFGGNQDALVIQIANWPIGSAGQWNDVNATNQLYFIVEYDTLLHNPSSEINTFNIYPNPATETFSITNEEQIASINIYDLSGKLLKTVSNDDNQIIENINISEFQKGMYLLHIKDKLDNNSIVKMIKN